MTQFNAFSFVTVFAVCATYGAQDAHACSMLACQPGQAFPMAGQLPQNALAWFVRWARDDGNQNDENQDGGLTGPSLRVLVVSNGDPGALETELELVAGEDNAPNSINAADGRFVPNVLVPVGTQLRVERADVCRAKVETSTLVVAPPASVPKTLGTLDVQHHFGPLELWTDSGSCTEPRDARYVDVTVQLATDAKPYADVLRYFLLVDGKPYRNTDWQWNTSDDDLYDDPDDNLFIPTIAGSALGAGTERAFAVCGPVEEYGVGYGEGVGEGEHAVQMVALLPDGTALESEVFTVDLTCPQPRDAGVAIDAAYTNDDDDSHPYTSDEGSIDSSASDNGNTHNDGGVSRDSDPLNDTDAQNDTDPANDTDAQAGIHAVNEAGVDTLDAGRHEPDAPAVKPIRQRKSGCSVAPTQSATTSIGTWVGLLLGVSAAWRRRRSIRSRRDAALYSSER